MGTCEQRRTLTDRPYTNTPYTDCLLAILDTLALVLHLLRHLWHGYQVWWFQHHPTRTARLLLELSDSGADAR
jgi:hypothetical protein